MSFVLLRRYLNTAAIPSTQGLDVLLLKLPKCVFYKYQYEQCHHRRVLLLVKIRLGLAVTLEKGSFQRPRSLLTLDPRDWA